MPLRDTLAPQHRLMSTTQLVTLVPASFDQYCRHVDDCNPTGWHIRISTPFTMKAAIAQICPPSVCGASIRQPRSQLPKILPGPPYTPPTQYYPCGWLLFSTRYVGQSELSMFLEIELLRMNSMYRWIQNPIRLEQHTVSTRPTVSADKVTADCLWIKICSPALQNEMDQLFRTLFTRSFLARPLGRPMHYVPRDYQSTDTADWNHFVRLQQIYWNNAERFSQTSHHDPYDTLTLQHGNQQSA